MILSGKDIRLASRPYDLAAVSRFYSGENVTDKGVNNIIHLIDGIARLPAALTVLAGFCLAAVACPYGVCSVGSRSAFPTCRDA